MSSCLWMPPQPTWGTLSSCSHWTLTWVHQRSNWRPVSYFQHFWKSKGNHIFAHGKCVNDLLCSGLFWSSRQLSVATSVVNSCWSGSPADNCMWSDWVKNRKTNEIVLNGACLVEGLFQNMRFKGKGTNRKKKNKNKNLPHRGHHFEGRYFPFGTTTTSPWMWATGCVA